MNIGYYRRAILVALVLGWCVVIFNFSSQSATESTETSSDFIEIFCNFIVPEFGDFSGAQRLDFINHLQFAVRKCAHFTTFGILGFLCWFALYNIKNKLRYALAVAFSFLYACSDEIHQIFVDGRSCELRDVLIDTLGAMLGTLFALLLTLLALHFRKQPEL
ncbi:MAG: VanZ family protein [Ruminococcus sp.]|nr:VanZ family protein [Ruminococcus sp.]